ncbi:MAG: DUF4340 domain-containing protein [Deltaproteobacteria bacterium]
MRGALIHGVLLAVMLVYGYRTWTRDKTATPTTGNVVMWDKSENELVSIEYKAPKKIVKIEKKADYWWGSDTTIETKPKAPKPGEGSGSAGSASAGSAAGSGSGSAAKTPPPPPEEEEVGRKTHEFPLGEAGDKLIKDFTAMRSLRDLGVPNDEAKKDYKLVDAKTTITVTFKDGPKTFLVGGSVYGGSDRYVVDQASGKAYVFAKDLISPLEIGESSLHLLDPRGFDAAKIDQVMIEAGGNSKSFMRTETEQEGTKRKTWADVQTKTANSLAANFIDGVNNLRPTEYNTTVKPSDMQSVMKLTYKSDKGAVLGTLQLLRYEKPGQLAEGQELDPANPPKGETEYYILTEKTRVPGLVRKDTAQRTENDIENVFSGKTEPEGAGSGSAHSIDPHGNPLGLKPGATPTPTVPGAGSAAMAPHAMGSAVPPHAMGVTPPAPGSAAPHPMGTPPAAGSAAPHAPPPAPHALGSDMPPHPMAVTPPAAKPATPPATGSAAH